MFATFRPCITAAAVLFLVTGCATTPIRLNDAVGPAPEARLADKTGQVIVYTEMHYPMQIGYEPAVRTPYILLDHQGTFLRRVASDDAMPMAVSLMAGDYVVRGSVGKDTLDISVRVEAGRSTVVHLDGKASDVPTGAAVYELQGRIVGWRAEPRQPSVAVAP